MPHRTPQRGFLFTGIFLLLSSICALLIATGAQESYRSTLSPLKESREQKKEESLHSDAPLSLDHHTIYSTPDIALIDTIVQKINRAEKQVLIQVYILSEKEIKSALIRAHKRGVTVELILENELYGSDVLSAQTKKELVGEGIPVFSPDHEQFTFTHSKFMVIDDEYVISSGNFAYSSFKTNREFLIFGNHPTVHSYLSDLFKSDKEHTVFRQEMDGVFLSPINTRPILERALSGAKESIVLSMQSLSDERVITLLEQASDRGVAIKICLGDPAKVTANKTSITRLQKRNIFVSAPKKPYIHTKSLLIDGKNWYIGSINYTTNSIDRNREIGLHLLLDESSQSKHMKSFASICSKEYTLGSK